MNLYLVGTILSSIILIPLLIINDLVYHGVMHLFAPVLLLSIHVIIFRHLIPEKRYGTYICFLLVLSAVIFFSFPNFTQRQAETKAADSYNLQKVEASIVPVEQTDWWKPFAPNWAYFFTGISLDGEEFFLVVNPDTGEVIFSEPYYKY